MRVYIPSRGRAELQRTWQSLPPQWRAVTMLVVPKNEKEEYDLAVGASHVFGIKASGIGKVRQWIIDQSNEPLLMLDDDLEFFARRRDDPSKFVKASPKQIDKMLAQCAKLLGKHAHIGIATREGGNRDVTDVLYNTRLLRALGYRPDVLKSAKVRFDRIPVMEDFDVALQLLAAGYSSAKLNRFVQDQPGSNTAGGCSTYRTNEVQAAGALGLKKLHPEFVKVTVKKGWEGLGSERLDVNVAWKKAFASYGGPARGV